MTDEETHPEGGSILRVVESKPSEAEIAADLKKRFGEAMAPALKIMDEAAAAGLLIQFDGIAVAPPFFKYTVLNVRVEKRY
jgi:hypothetical protein